MFMVVLKFYSFYCQIIGICFYYFSYVSLITIFGLVYFELHNPSSLDEDFRITNGLSIEQCLVKNSIISCFNNYIVELNVYFKKQSYFMEIHFITN